MRQEQQQIHLYPPIELCEKNLAGTVGAPTFQYVVVVGINPQSFINNVIDPTA